MKNIKKIFQHTKLPKKEIFIYFIFILLAAFFSLFTLNMLGIFMNLIFTKNATPNIDSSVIKYFNNIFTEYITQDPIGGKKKALLVLCIIMLVASVLKNLFNYLASYISSAFRIKILTDLREKIYNKIVYLHPAYFSNQRKGDLIVRIGNDTAEVYNSIIATLENFIKDPITILSSLIFMVYLNPKLSLLLLILLPLAGIIIGRVGKRLKRDSKELSELVGYNFSLIDETLMGIKIIKGFFAENLFINKFKKQNQDINDLNLKIIRRKDLASPMTETLGILVVCIILYVGGIIVLNTNGNGGQFITYIITFALIINPAKSFSNSSFTLQRGIAAMDRINEVIEEEALIIDKENAIEKNIFENDLVFKNVSFNYDSNEFITNFNMNLSKGQTIALVGSSGAGKSTIADLMARFHNISKGTITIDGIDIINIKIASLRNLISIVTQEPILFNDTIAANIALGKPTASINEIEAAAKIANAHNFIIKKDGGYESNIGDRGSKLSGGEKQRLTIARAILQNPQILILDEATASLDTESETLVKDALDKLMENRTTLVIAHRLSTIKNANEILVMQEGTITERGTHNELVAKGGFYNKLVQMQEFEN